MKELFPPIHLVWIIPLVCFGIFIIAATCYFLRREIASSLQKLFFPDTKRYIVPAGIISNVNTDKVQGPLTPEKIEALIAAAETIPENSVGAITPIEAQKPERKKIKHKKHTGFLRRFEIKLRLLFRSLKHKIKVWFAEFAGTEDSPSNSLRVNPAPVKIMQASAKDVSQINDGLKAEQIPPDPVSEIIPAAQPLLPAKEQPEAKTQENEELKEEAPVQHSPEIDQASGPEVELASQEIKAVSEVSAPEAVKEDSPLQADTKKEETAILAQSVKEEPAAPSKNAEEEIKIENPAEQIQIAPAPIVKPIIKQEAKAQNGTKTAAEEKKPFISDRTAMIAVLLILACFMIFLSARVKLLGSIIMRQRVEMRNMQKQIEMLRYEQNGFKVVIHERAMFPQKRYNK